MRSMDCRRSFVKSCRRIIIKVGTNVVTRAEDGKFALGRIGSLCEQVKELVESGIEVIIVTSGAVGMGYRLLRHHRTLNTSFADLAKPESQPDGKACAAVGQSGLITLYDTLFSLLDVASSQLLVTSRDFRNTEFRNQLVDTVNSLLAMQVVPIFNENDAISTREESYKENGQVFWDNDSLAALLASEVKADLLIFLMDVDGLYTMPPLQPGSKLIQTFMKEKHIEEVKYGEKSRHGSRGGMEEKVRIAQSVADAGVPVIITSGFLPDAMKKILRGEQIGTLFHKETSSLLQKVPESNGF
ncbi:hypothetical protein GOP47_0015567 [Adiantum capillus-veneris]|uniref:Aspartate/glutamate/uridylate kinase domain-containing protein n=1 Tax=Adiantum capillus-veneris TaxID=13818 RepID=A0A9D4ZE33_ADICA|nr:hypothetical protein GOP47_0015567 [Adiantum capillus-veneris]